MTSEQPPRDALRPLRPLPSIDVPLLRSERSALRSKQIARWAVAGTLVASAAGFVALALNSYVKPVGPSENHSAPPSLDETQAAGSQESLGAVPLQRSAQLSAGAPSPLRSRAEPRASTVTTESAPGVGTGGGAAHALSPGTASRVTHPFGRATSFRDALEHAGLSREESTALIGGLVGVIDFRRSQPTDTIAIERSESGALTHFEYRSSLTQRYEAACDEAGKWRARQIDVPIRTLRVARAGMIVGSLGDSLEGLKLSRSLAGVFSEVFEGQVNFSTDTRTGDQFRIIFDEEYVEDVLVRHGDVHAVEYKGGKAGLLRAFWHETKADADFYDEHGRALHGGWLRTPLRYDHVSSGFGMRFHPVLKRKQLHNGIDYAASSGTPVRAAAAGTVTFAGPKGANGNLLVLSHAQGFETFYAHLSRFASGLKSGAKVRQRQVIAYVGTTGRSTGPHLHFSLKKHGKFLDPATQLNGPGVPMPAPELPDYKRRVRELSAALEKLTPEQPAHVPSLAPSAAPADLGEEEL